MNREAFQLALKTAVALNCEIPAFTKWDRKQYYYPDLPKGYQISQYDLPLSRNGYLEISDPKGAFAPKRVGIIRAHLEEDAGKSMHDEAGGQGRQPHRPEPHRHAAAGDRQPARPALAAGSQAYLNELKLLLIYLGVSDCNMQEGSLRVDANINLHVDTPPGKVATPIVEVKNMNSFRAVERALALRSRAAVRGVAGDRPQAGRAGRAQDDPRLGRPGPGHAAAAAEGGVQRLPLLPRPGPGARSR